MDCAKLQEFYLNTCYKKPDAGDANYNSIVEMRIHNCVKIMQMYDTHCSKTLMCAAKSADESPTNRR